MNDWFADGATADYCIAIATSLTAKPSRLNHLEAASVPIGALTAWQGLFDRASLQPGEHILVHGGSGAVGVFAIQLARRIEKAFFIVEPNQKKLTEIARLLDLGELQSVVNAVVPLAKASEAYFGTVEGRRGCGKVVLSIMN